MLDFHTHTPGINAIVNLSPARLGNMEERGTYSVGIHPWDSENVTSEHINKLHECATHPRVVMIGECGIDKLRGGSIDLQTEIFYQHIELSESIKRPLLIHCVKAFQEIIAIHNHRKPTQKWIIHGFRHNEHTARQLLDKGILLSFGIHHNEKAVLEAGIDRLLLETDDSDIDIAEVYASIAHLFPGKDVKTIIDNNVKRLLSL